MKKYHVREVLLSVLFFGGFIGGIFFVNLCGNTYLQGEQILGEESLHLVRQAQIDARALFFHLLLHRGKPFLLFFLLGYTAAGLLSALALMGWMGFLGGVFAALFVIRLHLVGVLVFLAVILPQACAYVPAVCLLAGASYDRGWGRLKRSELPAGWQAEKRYLQRAALAFALSLAGMVLESNVNPWLLREVLNYFF